MTRLESLLAVASGADVPVVTSAPTDLHNRRVEGEGPLDATLVVLGESCGREEAETGRPFVGASGQKLRLHARLAGLNLDKARIENVYPFYPEGGSIESLHPDVLRQWQKDTLERLRQCHRATLVVAVGNVALETLTGHRDVSRRRGSVYTYRCARSPQGGSSQGFNPFQGKNGAQQTAVGAESLAHALGHDIKILAMIHPAAILHSGGMFEKHCRLDWERAKKLITPHEEHDWYCGCARERKRAHITPYRVGREDLYWYIQDYLKRTDYAKEILAIDIETPKIGAERKIVCVGFALGADSSLVLPFDGQFRSSIRQLCASRCIKVGHNFISYDRWWLKREGIEVGGEIRDTLALSHALDPASAHSLEFLCSRYLWLPWYKDEGHGHDIRVIEKDWPAYYNYCGTDACATWELHALLWPQLEQRGLVNFYRHHYEALYDPILDLSSHGVRVDHDARQALLAQCLARARATRDALGDRTGGPLFTLSTQRDRAVYAAASIGDPHTLDACTTRYGNEAVAASLERIADKSISGPMLKKLLYERLGLPVQLKRRASGEYTPTADATTLRKLRLEHGESRPEVQEVIDLAMEHAKVMKMASFCYDSHFDTDGRFRYSLKVNTEAARLSSSSAPNGRGTNSQNAPRDKRYRALFLPEPGHVLLEVDGSAVEGRLGFVHTHDHELIRLARLRSSVFDQHKYVASLIFLKPEAEVTRDERQVAKSINHAAMRDVQGLRISETLLKDGFVFSEEACEGHLTAYHKAFPAIRQWQQRIRRELRARKRLVNAWGRVWDVRYEVMNAELFRRGYSWLLQSECAEWMNTRGFVPVWQYVRGRQSRLLLHEHDGLVLSCPVEEVYDVALFLKEHLEVPRTYDGVELSIPLEYKVGRSWGESEEYKELPSRKELEATSKALMHSAPANREVLCQQP